jgi:N-methylhydantoinase A
MVKQEGLVGPFVIDVDVGGTFTDAIISSNSGSLVLKVETTPHELSQCLRDALERSVKALDVPDLKALLAASQVVRLSTSLSTNSLVEGRGTQCGLIVPRGRGSPYVSQLLRSEVSDLRLVQDMISEVTCTEADSGSNALLSLEDELRQAVQTLVERGASTIVVSLTGADFAEAEQRVKRIITKYYPRHFIGSLPILLSSQISSSPNFPERTNTALLNAYCHRAMAAHFYQIEDFLRTEGYKRPLLVVHCNGGSARVAKTRAILTINSGAAAGVFGVSRIAKAYDLDRVVSIDVGGTTTEIGVLHAGEIDYTACVSDHDMQLDVDRPVAVTLGLGGGSVARLGRSAQIALGPQSAGAFPGPACYGLGGTAPTLTDAYLVLGYLDEHYYLGGVRQISRERAVRAVRDALSDPLSLSCEQAALHVKNQALKIVGEGIRSVAKKVEVPLHELTLVAVGGAGGCVGPDLLLNLGMNRMCFFRHGAVFGAYGSSAMDVLHLYEHRLDMPCFGDIGLADRSSRTVNTIVSEIQRVACKDMQGEGFRVEEIRFEVEAELVPSNGSRPFRIAFPSPFLWASEDWPVLAERAAVKLGDDEPAAWEQVRLARLLVKARAYVPRARRAGATSVTSIQKHPREAYKGTRAIYGDWGAWIQCPVYQWDLLSVPQTMVGPVILESSDTTVVVPPGTVLDLDQDFNGFIGRG